MNNWLLTLNRLQQQNMPCVMVTVASTTGSTPRETGSKMIVTLDELFGTIGGGNLEFQACKIARDQLANTPLQQLKRFPLGAGLGQCCGGLVNLLFEPIVGAQGWIDAALEYVGLDKGWGREVPLHDSNSLVIVRDLIDEESTSLGKNRFVEVNRSSDIELTLFGAGHVGRAIINALRDLPVRTRWVDSRENEFPVDIPQNVEIICTDTPEAEIDAVNSDAYFLVMTHDHSLDQLLCEAILRRDDFAYFGLIGSKSKRRMFETRMAGRGIEADRFSTMVCPIGVDGITGKQPAMIAISVVAQILQVYDGQCQIKQKEIKLSTNCAGGVNNVPN
ncbi:MAG: xanthine dehydrogenase accessory protein XdhC [Gammaproteobacteria bacterium]|nr:xanthine dehydrogenase accessory protein XdhC [Gammaproteobacteria bacterium]